jgi:hypothetical protein
MDIVQAQCSCEKYSKEATCTVSEKAVAWDKRGNTGPPECLNMKCCGIVSTVYTKWFYGLSLSTAVVTIMGFALVAAHLYIS